MAHATEPPARTKPNRLLRLSLLFPPLFGGCAEHSKETTLREFHDEGALCLRSDEDGALDVTVTFRTCLSSSCDKALATSCKVTLDGTALTVESDGASESTGAEACTADCRFLQAKCMSNPLDPGDYEISHGKDSASLALPTDHSSLFDDEGPGALCEP